MNIEKLRNFEPILGEWYIDRKLSEGRSSDFYRVKREKNGRTDCLGLKTIRFPRTEEDFNRIMSSGRYETPEQYLKTLEAELHRNMKKMMSLRANGNIVRFDDYMIVREFNSFHVIILMEQVRPLSEHLTEKRATSREIAKLGLDLSRALSGFRREGIMHREVKPENVFVSDSGVYKLGDFGISSSSETGDMREGLSIYLAPEVIRQNEPDTCSDIYSLGILMYKLINNNRVPFLPEFPAPITLEDRRKAFQRRMSGEALPAPTRAAAQLSRIILAAAAFDPSERYRDPLLLETDLKEFLFGAVPKGYVPKVSEYRGADGTDALFDGERTQAVRSEKREFEEAFSDDEEKRPNNGKKAAVAVIVVIVLVLAAVMGGFAARNLVDVNKETSTTAAPLTNAPTTAAEVTTQAPTTEKITTTAAPTTTAAETTTAEPETTAPETYGEETTLEEETAAGETTAGESQSGQTAESSGEEPVLFAASKHRAGDAQKDGRVYAELSCKSARMMLSGAEITQALLYFDQFGPSPKSAVGKTFICQVSSSGVVLSREEVSFGIIYNESPLGADVECNFVINSEMYYEEDTSYYLVFEEGAISSDSYYSMPTQVKLALAE